MVVGQGCEDADKKRGEIARSGVEGCRGVGGCCTVVVGPGGEDVGRRRERESH